MKYVYYFAYGSNICEERFRFYIEGGRSHFNNKEYSGCTDKKRYYKNDGVIKYEVHNHKLYFAKESPSWNNSGVAFIEENLGSNLIGRIYKVTKEQFDEIQRQEGSVWYGKIKELGKKDGLKVITFTNKDSSLQRNQPNEEYLKVIKEGLLTLGLSDVEIESYLKDAIEK